MHYAAHNRQNSLQYDYFHFSITTSHMSSLKFSFPSTLKITPSKLAFELEVKWQKFLKNLCRMQLIPTVATSASTHAQQLLTSRHTCENIREKSLSSATNVASLVRKPVDSNRSADVLSGWTFCQEDVLSGPP